MNDNVQDLDYTVNRMFIAEHKDYGEQFKI